LITPDDDELMALLMLMMPVSRWGYFRFDEGPILRH